MWLKRKVVMLPTNEKSNLHKDSKNLHYLEKANPSLMMQAYHLYFLSYEEIKEGDWYYNIVRGTIQQYFNQDRINDDNWKKIIATTDNLYIHNPLIPKEYNTFPTYLPQPSQSFIEKFVEEYNKGNVITDVMVEYEEYAVGSYGLSDGEPTIDERLKINPKDNTITIRKVKDSWTRGEVQSLLRKFANDADNEYRPFTSENIQAWSLLYGYDGKKNWIEQNL